MSGGLSILMPVFNERATVEAAIDDALTAELPVPARQVVVVDDGSTDGTRELLASSAFPDPVTVIYQERNLGKGAAVRTALMPNEGRKRRTAMIESLENRVLFTASLNAATGLLTVNGLSAAHELAGTSPSG